ncbi:MAG: Tol-Pal system beta propeller repeat protein TolB [bacterium]
MIFLFFLFLSDASADPKIYLDINAPAIKKLPVAIQIFKNLKSAPEDLPIGNEAHETLSDDLSFSGLLQVLDPTSFIEDTAASDTDPSKIRFEDWRIVGADVLIKGTYMKSGDQLQATFFLYDVILQKQISGKRYYGRAGDVRRMAHRFANDVIKQITGEEGVFDTRVSYLSVSDGFYEIHVMDYDGHNDRVILKEKTIIVSPKWSTDGEKIIFTSYREKNPDLYQIVIQTGEIQKISGEPGINTGGVYSPGGGRLAYVMSKDGNPEIYILDKYSKKPKMLTKNFATDVSPSWSPDGKQITFMSDRAGNPQIYITDYQGENVSRVTMQGKYNATPAWSPRGDRIAFASLTNGHFQIATIKPDGTQMVILTANSGNNEFPSWSPDGRFLCFSSTMNGKADIYIINANGTNIRRITSNPAKNSAPNWSPNIFIE